MALEITKQGRFFKIKNTLSGKIKAITIDDVRFNLDDKLTILKGANYPIEVILSHTDVTTPTSSSMSDLLSKLSNIT